MVDVIGALEQEVWSHPPVSDENLGPGLVELIADVLEVALSIIVKMGCAVLPHSGEAFEPICCILLSLNQGISDSQMEVNSSDVVLLKVYLQIFMGARADIEGQIFAVFDLGTELELVGEGHHAVNLGFQQVLSAD